MRPLSVRNPRVQRLARLARRRGERTAERALLVEGPVLVAAALDAGWTVTELYVDDARTEDRTLMDLIDRVEPTADVWTLPAEVLDRVGDAVTSQGATAVVARPEVPPPAPDTAPLVLVLAEVGDPGNAGTLIRAAAAAGAGAVIAAGGVDPTSPKVVRSSAGAVFHVPVVDEADPVTAVTRLRAGGYRAVGTAVRGARPYDSVDLTEPTAIVLGNESHGLDPDVLDHLDALVTIPMAGPTESLNVAMAGTILCFESLRQRRATGEE